MNGTVMLSLDKLYVSMATVSYDEHTRMITINNLFTTGSMKIGSRIATVNGKQITYSAAFQQVNKQLYMPLRYVNDTIGGSLDWNAKKREAVHQLSQFCRRLVGTPEDTYAIEVIGKKCKKIIKL